ncbi:relaxase/mobilization nuclease domain-containing protein [Kineococcus sp. SYSU DK005]|uniref:relaxase/mobilization nuclease domain-containing protein n=1 Tax=Kineococcus sp. SYSU DK005 TaxID=3383126 RepID=UPI003D7E88EB
MIAKITRGSRAGDLAAYLHGPGTHEEHVYDGRAGGAVIASNLGLEGERDGALWALMLKQAAAQRPEITRPIWHSSLRCAPQDRTLSDAEWADVAQGFAEGMGLAEHPWVAVRHGADHIHLATSRVGWDGRVWRGSHDRRQAQSVCAGLEREHELTPAPRRSSEQSRRSADHQVSSGEWRRGQRTGEVPPRVQLAERVRAAVEGAAGRGRAGFEEALQRAGVDARANVASTGRVAGYSFHLPGHVDAAGEPVWMKASQLDKSLSWSKLAPVLETPRPAPVVQVPRKLLETRARHQARTEQAVSEAVADQERRAMVAVRRDAERRTAGDAAWWRQRHAQAHGAGDSLANGAAHGVADDVVAAGSHRVPALATAEGRQVLRLAGAAAAPAAASPTAASLAAPEPQRQGPSRPAAPKTPQDRTTGALAARPDQEHAPRPAPMKENHMQQQTGSGGQTDPDQQATRSRRSAEETVARVRAERERQREQGSERGMER